MGTAQAFFKPHALCPPGEEIKPKPIEPIY